MPVKLWTWRYINLIIIIFTEIKSSQSWKLGRSATMESRSQGAVGQIGRQTCARGQTQAGISGNAMSVRCHQVICATTRNAHISAFLAASSITRRSAVNSGQKPPTTRATAEKNDFRPTPAGGGRQQNSSSTVDRNRQANPVDSRTASRRRPFYTWMTVVVYARHVGGILRRPFYCRTRNLNMCYWSRRAR